MDSDATSSTLTRGYPWENSSVGTTSNFGWLRRFLSNPLDFFTYYSEECDNITILIYSYDHAIVPYFYYELSPEVQREGVYRPRKLRYISPHSGKVYLIYDNKTFDLFVAKKISLEGLEQE